MKLSDVQKTLKAPKNQFNAFGKYNYRSAEDILEALKPILNGEAKVILSDDIVMVGDRYYVRTTATFFGEDGTTSVTAYAREEESKKGQDGSQITGASSSYARKYALNGLFLIDDNKDSDTTNKHDSKDDAILTKIKNAQTENELKEIYASLDEEQQSTYVNELSKRKKEIKK